MNITVDELPTELKFAMYAKLLDAMSKSKWLPKEESDALRKKINTLLYYQLNGFVISYITKHYPTFANSKEAIVELTYSCWEVIFEAFPKYNGQYTLTTFVTNYIKEGAKEQISFWINKSVYQVKVWAKIRKTLDEINEDKVTRENFDKVVQLSGLSRTKVMNALLTDIASKKNYIPDSNA